MAYSCVVSTGAAFHDQPHSLRVTHAKETALKPSRVLKAFAKAHAAAYPGSRVDLAHVRLAADADGAGARTDDDDLRAWVPAGGLCYVVAAAAAAPSSADRRRPTRGGAWAEETIARARETLAAGRPFRAIGDCQRVAIAAGVPAETAAAAAELEEGIWHSDGVAANYAPPWGATFLAESWDAAAAPAYDASIPGAPPPGAGPDVPEWSAAAPTDAAIARVDWRLNKDAARALLRKGLPVVLTNCPLHPPAQKAWTAASLAEAFGERPLETVWAPAVSRRFTVFWNRGTYGDRTRTADKYRQYSAPPTNGNEYGTLKSYLANAPGEAGFYADGRARYVQQTLEARARPGRGETWPKDMENDPCLPANLADDLRRLDAEILSDLRDAAGFLHHVKTKLYVGHEGTLSRCHCDSYDGLIIGVAGRKRVVLFDPLMARNLCVFPAHHPLELRPRVHVDAPDLRRFPRYGDAASRSCVLGRGEILYVPHHWWHHIENVSREPAISANLWLSTGGESVDASGTYHALWRRLEKPLSPGWVYELSRMVELGVAASLPGGASDVPPFLRHCGAELAFEDAPDVPPLWHGLRARLFEKLGSFLGPAGLPAFFDDLLDSARFEGIAAVEPEMGFGGRDPAAPPGAPVWAPLV